MNGFIHAGTVGGGIVRLDLAFHEIMRALTGKFRMRGMLVGCALVAALAASPAVAEIRVSTSRFFHICRVVVAVDNYHTRKIVYDGRLTRAQVLKFNAGTGTVCVSRTYNPNDCRTEMTPWQCKADRPTRSIILKVH